MAIETAVLTCSSCGAEAEHELHYAGRLLHSTRCTVCGHVVRHDQRDLYRSYLEDLEHRVMSKPIRMTRRARQDPVGFAVSLPRKLMQQPPKFFRELRALLGRD